MEEKEIREKKYRETDRFNAIKELESKKWKQK